VSVEPQHPVPGVPDDLLRLVLDKLVAFEPDAIAVLVRGSYAAGTAAFDSDLDLTVITDAVPRAPYRTWFEERGDELLPISVSAKQAPAWLAKNQQPAEWSLGFPATDVASYLWASDSARAALGDDPSARRPAGVLCLEDFVNTAVKVRRAAGRSDEVAVRIYARETALLAPALLRPLNPEQVVTDSRDAILAALDLKVAPEHYREDFRVAAGLDPAHLAGVAAATLRLGSELLSFLRERAPDVDPQPEIRRYLADGTFERYLAGCRRTPRIQTD
jgi:hypothetical protein